MPLYQFLLVVISLSCGSLSAPQEAILRPLVATAGLLVGWAWLSHLGARIVARQVTELGLDPGLGARWLELQLDWFRWLGIGVVLLCLGGFGLAPALDHLPVFGDSLLAKSLALLLPGLWLTAATWSAEHRYGVLLGYSQGGVAVHFRTLWQAFRSRWAWLIVPVLFLVGCVDLIASLPIPPGAAGAATVAVVLLIVPVGLPLAVAWLFRTEPLAGEQRAWVAELFAAAGLPRTAAVRWQTGGRNWNAMVAGFLPGVRTLLLSDRMLDELPRDQLAMVLLHEAAHLRRKHVPLRAVTVLPAWAVGASVTGWLGDGQGALVVGSAVGIALTLCLLRWVAYRTEFDADRHACLLAERFGGTCRDVPADLTTASAALAAALLRVTEDQPAARRPTWLHPGLGQRLSALRRLGAVPAGPQERAGEDRTATHVRRSEGAPYLPAATAGSAERLGES